MQNDNLTKMTQSSSENVKRNPNIVNVHKI